MGSRQQVEEVTRSYKMGASVEDTQSTNKSNRNTNTPCNRHEAGKRTSLFAARLAARVSEWFRIRSLEAPSVNEVTFALYP